MLEKKVEYCFQRKVIFCSGCVPVGRAVASDNKAPGFESGNFVKNINSLLVLYKDIKEADFKQQYYHDLSVYFILSRFVLGRGGGGGHRARFLLLRSEFESL